MQDSFKSVAINETNPKFTQCIKRKDSLYDRGNSIRSEFARDYTRLIHCRAYRRLKHKTQVFCAPHNDHICTRMEHVIHVASTSKTIANYLGLNAELTEAIATGHDIGHAPFGHAGEDILNSLMSQKEGTNAPKKFWHERNSLFFADFIETLGNPDGSENLLNLTYAVRDGIVCHCGEIDEQGIKPRDNAIDLYDIKRPGVVSPFTWEGCIVKVSDKIAFLGRDIEDARAYHIIDMSSYRELREIVASTLGFDSKGGAHRSGRAVNTTVLMNDMIVDLCEQSSPEKGICFSEPYFKFIQALKKFSLARIYNNWRLLEFKNYAQGILGCIYRTLMRTQVYAQNHRLDHALKYAPDLRDSFLNWVIKYTNYDEEKRSVERFNTKNVFDINDSVSWEKCVIEYISGMTDQYAINVFNEIISF